MRSRLVPTVIGGLIATIVGGLAVAVILRSSDLLANIASLAWGVVIWILDTLASSHSVPGWAILVMVALALFGLIVVGILLIRSHRSERAPPYSDYTEDMLDGAKWRWIWTGNRIGNLWCFCPSCDAQLVCRVGHQGTDFITDFICEHCPSDGSLNRTRSRGRVVATLHGDSEYAVAATEREILRRIRTRER